MKWNREKFKVPSQDDYLSATVELDRRYPHGELLAERAIREVREFPMGFMTAVKVLADSVVHNKNDRIERIDTLRSMAIGAGVGVLLAEVAHDRPNIIHAQEAKVSAIHITPDASADEMAEYLHIEYDEGVKDTIGEETVQWLENKKKYVAENGIISSRHHMWFPIGAGVSLGMLYGISVQNSSKKSRYM